MRRKSVVILSAVVGIMASTVSALAGPKANNNNVNTAGLAVIQGTVTAIQGNWLTVKTIDWQPSNPPGAVVPQYVIAGTTYRVNVSHAVEETFSGAAVKPTVFVGETIVAVGRMDRQDNGKDSGNGSVSAIASLSAQVIERAAGGNSIGSGAATTAASFRVR